MLSRNQLASVLGNLPLPTGAIGRGDLEQTLGLFRLDDQPPSYTGAHAAVAVGLVYLRGAVAGMVIA